jgi:hypothetical protein
MMPMPFENKFEKSLLLGEKVKNLQLVNIFIPTRPIFNRIFSPAYFCARYTFSRNYQSPHHGFLALSASLLSDRSGFASVLPEFFPLPAFPVSGSHNEIHLLIADFNIS